jgi:hypothetical protein
VSTAAYDAKNEENFEAVTLALDAALKKMEKDSSISANATQLAKLAGVHRNTIYHRVWPLERLQEIKAKRAQQKKDEAATKAQTRTPEELLELSRLEIVYWLGLPRDNGRQEAILTSLSWRSSCTQPLAAITPMSSRFRPLRWPKRLAGRKLLANWRCL